MSYRYCMLLCFLRFKGGVLLTNETFCLLSEEEKHTKFKAAMKGKTKGCLNEEELHSILMSISLNRQYAISVYRDGEEFCVFVGGGRVLKEENHSWSCSRRYWRNTRKTI